MFYDFQSEFGDEGSVIGIIDPHVQPQLPAVMFSSSVNVLASSLGILGLYIKSWIYLINMWEKVTFYIHWATSHHAYATDTVKMSKCQEIRTS